MANTDGDNEGTKGPVPDFVTPEGLRSMLVRLDESGYGAWRHDPDARALIEYTVSKYRQLAIKWHRDPAEIGYAAFVAMLGRGVRMADDPWGAVTVAVRRTLIAETEAERLLISTAQARHPRTVEHEPPVRAGEHTFLYELAPATNLFGQTEVEPRADGLSVDRVIAETADLLTGLGWPAETTHTAVDFIVARVMGVGSTDAAYESLRRDVSVPARLDISRHSWSQLLRLVLGERPHPGRPARKGLLARLLRGDSAESLLADDELVLTIATTASAGERNDA